MKTKDPSGLTAKQMVLVACRQLEATGSTSYAENTILVAAWKLFPQTFGLDGFQDQHPDNNTIRSLTSGKKGMVKHGLLERVGEKTYVLTDDGRAMAQKIVRGEMNGKCVPNFTAKAAELMVPPRLDGLLDGLLGSRATYYFRTGRKTHTSLDDALAFWGLTAPMADERSLRLGTEAAAKIINLAAAAIAANKVKMRNGRVIKASEVESLRRCHEWLLEQFRVPLAKLVEPKRRMAV